MEKLKEAEKLKAIGLGNRVDSEREVRKRKQLELQAMINEKKAELERLSAQHDSLTSVELQQKALDGTLAAMEWPGQAEACASGARLLRVDPCVPPEQQLAPVLEALFEAFWWTDSVNSWILG